MNNIRQRLDQHSANGGHLFRDLIKLVRGKGYKLSKASRYLVHSEELPGRTKIQRPAQAGIASAAAHKWIRHDPAAIAQPSNKLMPQHQRRNVAAAMSQET